MTRHPSRSEDSCTESQNASAEVAHTATIPSLAFRKMVRIRCIEEPYIVEKRALLPSSAHAECKNQQRTPHAVPYSVALADGVAQFAKSEPERCGFSEYIPAQHTCGARSVATVQTFNRGAQRACVRHAAASQRFGLVVAYDAGYVVAE